MIPVRSFGFYQLYNPDTFGGLVEWIIRRRREEKKKSEHMMKDIL